MNLFNRIFMNTNVARDTVLQTPRDKTFFDITIDDEPAGRIVFEVRTMITLYFYFNLQNYV